MERRRQICRRCCRNCLKKLALYDGSSSSDESESVSKDSNILDSEAEIVIISDRRMLDNDKNEVDREELAERIRNKR